jgi:serine/threonine protein kinase
VSDRSSAISTQVGHESKLLELLEAFDRVWRGPVPPDIADFLSRPSPDEPHGGSASIRQQLEELIKIDMEYRWRRSGPAVSGGVIDRSSDRGRASSADSFPARLRLEGYLRSFPELGPLADLPPALIAEEYRIRWRWGDRPLRAEFHERFKAQASQLDAVLAAVESELGPSSHHGRLELNRSPDAGRTCEAPWFCPQCHTPFLLESEAPEQMACPSCGTTLVARPSPDQRTLPRPPLSRVGRYILGDLLGVGGFGTVWSALDPDLRRAVAVKLPRAGRLGTPAEEERFLREARSAAQLRHPGIVAVHDTGRDQGTIYMVSELVRGVSLARKLEQGRLGFREAAILAAQVADALEYAHRQGVVHRDLKPSNILLESPGSSENESALANEPPAFRARIVDFGLARREAVEVTMTLDGHLLGTPAYMSPEQLRSPHQVDGRSDLYSLGVVLYQLLTDELPFRGVSRMLQLQVLEDEPRAPRRLNDRIPRDLETITLKCLEKDPARRYQSAGALADDLRRFLAREVILARPTGAVERLWRSCLRKPLISGLAAALVLALIVGASAATVQWRRAEANVREAKWERDRADSNLARARRFVDDLSTRVLDKINKNEEGMHAYESPILETALQFYEAMALPQSRDPSTRLEAGQACARMGLLQLKLGRVQESEANYQRAVAILGDLIAEHPESCEYLKALATARSNLALSYNVGHRWDLAGQEHQKAISAYRRLLAMDVSTHDDQSRMASCLNNLGRFYHDTGRPADAATAHREQVAIYESLVAADARNTDYRYMLAESRMNLATALRDSGLPAEARTVYREAWQTFDSLLRERPEAIGRWLKGQVYNDLAAALTWTGETAKAMQAFRNAAEIYEAMIRDHPDDFQYRKVLAIINYNLGTTHHQLGHRDLAEPFYRRAVSLHERLIAERPEDIGNRIQMAKNAMNYGIMLCDTARFRDAEHLLARSCEILDRMIHDDRQGALTYRTYLWEPLAALGKVYRSTGRTSQALESYRRARDVISTLPHPDEQALYGLAATQAQCTMLEAKGGGEPADGARTGVRSGLDLAVKLLRNSLLAGFNDCGRLRQDTDFDPLRSRADFQLILLDVAFPVDPLAP